MADIILFKRGRLIALSADLNLAHRFIEWLASQPEAHTIGRDKIMMAAAMLIVMRHDAR